MNKTFYIVYKTNIYSERWGESGRLDRDLHPEQWVPLVLFLPHIYPRQCAEAASQEVPTGTTTATTTGTTKAVKGKEMGHNFSPLWIV